MTRLSKSIIGPLLATTLLIINFAFPISLAPSFVVLVWATYAERGKAGLIVAGVITGFAMYYVVPVDPVRSIIVAASAFFMAWMVARLKRQTILAETTRQKALFVDELNGNLKKLEDINNMLAVVLDSWDFKSSNERREAVIDVKEQIASLLTTVRGWYSMALAKGFVLEDEGRKRGLFE